MRRTLAAIAILASSALNAEATRCDRWPERFSTAFNPAANRITLPWRTDYPATLPSQAHAWESVPFNLSQSVPRWRDYMAAVLSEVRASGLQISNNAISMSPTAQWYIAPWMDQGANGREFLLGLTAERGPDPGDLSPTSVDGRQVWAIGFYNAEGAFALGQIFADPCNPKIPAPVGGQPWRFPNRTASFKLLFTDAPASEVNYLSGSPEVLAMINPPTGTGRVRAPLRLLQVDIAVRDPRASGTEWVMGTYIWKGPRTGDGLFDNLVPVGLMWGNDPNRQNNTWARTATLRQSRLNPDLAGVVWQGTAGTWPQRPYPGFQGRLNGPADNLRSSCLSCHGLAQWRRNPTLGLTPTYALNPPRTPQQITQLRRDYFRNVRGGTLAVPTPNTTPLDYSLQLEAAFTRLCGACRAQQMTGPTPDVCKVPGRGQITDATCQMPPPSPAATMAAPVPRRNPPPHIDMPPRQ